MKYRPAERLGSGVVAAQGLANKSALGAGQNDGGADEAHPQQFEVHGVLLTGQRLS
ncbi:MAG: hypothetical protein AAF869_10600 [Pseudomonadota bacterium]